MAEEGKQIALLLLLVLLSFRTPYALFSRCLSNFLFYVSVAVAVSLKLSLYLSLSLCLSHCLFVSLSLSLAFCLSLSV